MNAELLKQARDALASCTDQKCLSTGPNSYMHILTFDAGKVASAIAAIDAALAQPASEDAWLRKSLQLAAKIRDATDDETQAAHFDQLEHHLRARPAPEGFVLVPVEPTEAMIAVGLAMAYDPIRENDIESVWRTMVNAAKESGK